jgi:integrase
MTIKDNDVVEYLNPEESERFLSVVKTWSGTDVRHMVLLAYVTGMRRGAIFKLEERDIDFHLNLIYLRGTKDGKSTSTGLSDFAKNIINNQLAWKSQRFPESPYIFPGRTGGLRKDCSGVDKIKKKARLPSTFRPFHGLRHHLAVTMANSSQFTLDMIATAMTHKSASFTKKGKKRKALKMIYSWPTTMMMMMMTTIYRQVSNNGKQRAAHRRPL